MRILTRYLLRLHVAPFLFAVTGLTLLLLLDQVSKRFGDLIGKGLHWTVIAEVFVYSVPFILAQTLPMAVLIAVLYTFNRLAGDREITAMKACGLPLSRLIAPLLIAATFLAAGMTWFNDTVLPESNHHLQSLLTSIAQKKPTFALREQAINEVLPSRLYVQPASIDRERSTMVDVNLYDERDTRHSRTIFAGSGEMAFAENGEDVYLTLRAGVMQERETDRPHGFRRTRFAQMVMRVEDVTNELERDTLSSFRSDREMNISQMRERVAAGREQIRSARRAARDYLLGLTELLVSGSLDLEREPLEMADRVEREPSRGGAGPGSADSVAEGDGAAAGDEAAEAADAAALGQDEAAGPPEGRVAARRFNQPRDAVARLDDFEDRAVAGHSLVNKFAVEIHKKVTIPAACVVFVLIGAPIAVRFPRAGVALVVAVSLVFFAAYYVALVGGEELADNRTISPFWAMWAPNVLFGLVGVGALWRATRVS